MLRSRQIQQDGKGGEVPNITTAEFQGVVEASVLQSPFLQAVNWEAHRDGSRSPLYGPAPVSSLVP